MTNTTKKPIHTLRDGALSVSIWQNDRAEGGYWYEAKPGRTYSDQNENPKTAHSFSNGDILAISELLRQAYNWIRVQKAKDRAEANHAEAA